MALSAPSTPRTVYATPRRAGKVLALAPPQTPECFSKVTLETPNSEYKRRVSKDKYDQENNLTVAVRIRPMNARELAVVGTTDVVRVDGKNLTITSNLIGGQANLDHVFQYDHIFWSVDENKSEYATQEDVFEVMGEPLLQSAFKGYNACLFAYGQTGSGKSFSMMGPNLGELIDIEINAGVTPRFCRELFNKISSLGDHSSATVEVSYFEIYNEKIHDLLAVNVNNQRRALKVREHPVWGPYVVDLSTHVVKNYKELRNWLVLGNKNRATAATAMNEKSSRSHSIFSIEVCLSEGIDDEDASRRSKISLVDLAGSERLSNTMNNDERMRQGVSINKSLLTLGKVISSLAESRRTQFVPYRDSVLTWLLRESLGGNSLTSMLATITPASSNLEETLATLRYACQARSIVNRARINENAHDKLIRELRAEVKRLRALRQDFERNSIGSIINISDSFQQEQELEELRGKLTVTEEKLMHAQKEWELRFMETKERQLKELSEAEKRKEELESHIRIMKSSDSNVKLSPYQSNFLEELENVLKNEAEKENVNQPYTKEDILKSMNNIYDSMNNLRPTVESSNENVKLMFARINKLLQSFESALINNIPTSDSKKKVTFL